MYGYDKPNERVVAVDKANAEYVAQYRLDSPASEDGPSWEDLRGMYVVPGVDEAPPTVFWVSPTGLHQATLGSLETPDASGAPSGDPDASAEASAEPTTP